MQQLDCPWPGCQQESTEWVLGSCLSIDGDLMLGRVSKRALLNILSLAAVVLLGVIHLPPPFTGDTAMFLAGAKVMANDGVYYLDYWDVKQPGIYLFFQYAGELFGFNEIGVHEFELVWMLFLSIVLIRVVRDSLDNKWLSAFVPLATVGVYYINADSWHLTQVEILVSLPLLVTLWLATKGYATDKAAAIGYFIAGVSIVVVALFKFLYLPLALALLLLPLTRFYRERGLVSSLTRLLLPSFFGFLVASMIFLLWQFFTGSLYEFYWGTFVFPLKVASEVAGGNIKQLVGSLIWMGKIFAPFFPLIVIGLVATIRNRPLDSMGIQFVLWLTLGLMLVLIQKYSWWEYQFQLLFVPLGVLAIIGLDIVISWLRDAFSPVRAPYLHLASLIAAFYLLVGGATYSWLNKAQELGWSMYSGNGWGEAYRKSIDTTYRAYWKSTRFLYGPDSRVGEVFIIGDPMMLLLSGRDPAPIPFNGWGAWTSIDSQWKDLPFRVRDSHVSYIFIAKAAESLVRRKSPGLIKVLDNRYRKLIEVDERYGAGPWVAGTWYEALEVSEDGQV